MDSNILKIFHKTLFVFSGEIACRCGIVGIELFNLLSITNSVYVSGDRAVLKPSILGGEKLDPPTADQITRDFIAAVTNPARW